MELIEADASLSLADIQAIQGDSSPVYAQDILPYLLALPSTLRQAQGSGHRFS